VNARFTKLPLVLAILAGWPACTTAAEPPSGPLVPTEAVRTFRLADDRLVIELVAAEPDLVSPVAVAWDEDGRMYVAEMIDYPVGPVSGKIKRLEFDDNGKLQKTTVLADKLPFPNGVLPWQGGVLVTAAPHIWYLKERPGDPPTATRRIVLTGFNEGNQQLRVNGLTWGLDNWVYGANGRSDGMVRRPDVPPEKAISISRRDFRFNPQSGRVEAVAGFSQFGLARDDWGRRFLSWNTLPFRQVILEERFLERNPYLNAESSVAQIADPADQGRLFAISPPPTTFNREPVHFFNASCGNTIFRGQLLGPAYRGNAFVCEPLTNLVHRRALVANGVAFLATRTEQGKEFLASTDSWFHPVNLATGPDGALYVVDFYRQWVEHPHFVPEKMRAGIDWRKGAQHGRIWRIRLRGEEPRPIPKLSKAGASELVRCFSHANGWVRDTAQRLLVERQDRKTIPYLKDILRRPNSPLAKVHALWTLQGLGALEEAFLLNALKAEEAEVREQALLLCEGRLAGSTLVQAVLDCARHPEIRVRFQAALALGEIEGREALRALATITERDAGNEWVRTAVLSSLKESAWPFLRLLLERHPEWLATPSADQVPLLIQAAALVGARNRDAELAECLRLLSGSGSGKTLGRLALLAGLSEASARVGRPLRLLLSKPPEPLTGPVRDLAGLFESARALALSEQEVPHARVLAVEVLTRAQAEGTGWLLIELMQPKHPPSVQSASARGLAELGDKGLIGQVFERWGSYATSTRRDVIASLLRSPSLTALLLEAIEKEQLAAADLDPTARALLDRIPDANLQRRARKILQKYQTADRREVVKKYQEALQLEGDARRGAGVFAKHCLACHQMQGQRYRVGPDLSGISSRPSAALLEDILDPSKEVSPDFINYTLTTKGGQILSGLVISETATSVRLRRNEGVEDTVLRREIDELRASGKSLMPEGLEQVLTLRDMADLLSFLRRPAPLSGR